jgi:glycerophosphoryl diester phosphodiesterase
LILKILSILLRSIIFLQILPGSIKILDANPILEGRAILPATTFVPGPTSGIRLGSGLIHRQEVPFVNKQPVQGLSAVLDNGNGSFDVLTDNGFGNIENSADFHLRVYTIRPQFKTKEGGSGNIRVEGFIELYDPDKQIPFSLANQFTTERILTGADFDPESMQRAPDRTLWFGDEFGPFLLHTDARGKVLEPPTPLPDFDNPGREIRSPQNPLNEEASAVRIMNAVHTHARMHGGQKIPVFSPWEALLDDDDPKTFAESRQKPAIGSGLASASSEIFNIPSIQGAGYPIVVWTVNDKTRILELMKLGVNGIISDRPDLLRQAVEGYDANGDGIAGDFLDNEGLIDLRKFDAQGHRGGRNLRPENTLPAMEVALDSLMTTLETDIGITLDGVPVLNHDPHVQASTCRLTDGTPYADAHEKLVKDLRVSELQSLFICDKLLPHRIDQKNDRTLSPVSVAFASKRGLKDPYVMPILQQLFDFVKFYADYYRSGPGSSHPDAQRRWKNAERVRFNIETKINPRKEFVSRTLSPEPFTKAVANVIVANGLQDRADIQSFDFHTLLIVQEQFPQIRTVYLFGDFPVFSNPRMAGSGEGNNLQPEEDGNNPWLAGLFWPYRVTTLTQPFRTKVSGGFEGMALTPDGKKLLPLLEKPLAGGEPGILYYQVFDLTSKKYTDTRYSYRLDPRSQSATEFILLDDLRGLTIERDESQGDLKGFKTVFKVRLKETDKTLEKEPLIDLLNISDPDGISEPGLPGDFGIGRNFSFPFITIEALVVFDRYRIGVLNDNNYPFTMGRHKGTEQPDDTEFIIIRLDKPLGE